MSSKDYIQS